MTLTRFALAHLRAAPLTTGLNVTLLALGTATIVVLMLIAHQMTQTLTRDARNIDLVLGAKGSPVQLVLSAVYHADIPTGNISYAEAQQWAENRQIESAVPLSLGDSVRGFRIVGTTTQFLDLYEAQVAEGKRWEASMEAVLGSEVAAASGLSIGDTFSGAHGLSGMGEHHDEQPYRVVGVLASTGSVADRLVLTSLESVWDVHADGHSHDEHHAEHHDEEEAHDHEEHEHESKDHQDSHHAEEDHDHHEHEAEQHEQVHDHEPHHDEQAAGHKDEHAHEQEQLAEHDETHAYEAETDHHKAEDHHDSHHAEETHDHHEHEAEQHEQVHDHEPHDESEHEGHHDEQTAGHEDEHAHEQEQIAEHDETHAHEAEADHHDALHDDETHHESEHEGHHDESAAGHEDEHAHEDKHHEESHEHEAGHEAEADSAHEHEAEHAEEDREITAMLLSYRSPLAAVSLPQQINRESGLQAAAPAFELARLLRLVGVGMDGLRLFALILVLSAALSIFAALYSALNQRRGDLAMMRCLGATRTDVMLALLIEGLLLAVIGVALGLLVGHATVEVIGQILQDSQGLQLTGLMFLPVEWSLIIGLLLVGLLSAALPAWQAYRTDVSRTLAQS